MYTAPSAGLRVPSPTRADEQESGARICRCRVYPSHTIGAGVGELTMCVCRARNFRLSRDYRTFTLSRTIICIFISTHSLKHLYPNLPLTLSTHMCKHCYNRALELVSSTDN